MPRRTLWRWAVVLIPGLLLFFIPVHELNTEQRHLLAFFVATIIGLVAQPVPMGVTVVAVLSALVLTRTLPPLTALSGFANPTVWLIFAAFLFARAVTATGFGTRIAFFFIGRFGKTPLTLGYSIAVSDLVLAPFVPSDTARGGGIIYPITRSVARALGSEPGPTARKIGGFLVLVGFHSTYVASGMFLTGMAANALMADFARKIGHVELTWLRWFAGACIPGFLSLLLVPYLIFRLNRPTLLDTEEARRHARRELHAMGRMSRNERWLIAILLSVMAGWISSPSHYVPNAFVALSGVSAILICRVLEWKDLLAEDKAWDALIWFAPLIMMADELNKSGVIRILSASLFNYARLLPWGLAFLLLILTYLYVHYGFASMTAHITALYPGFLTAILAVGAPPLLASFALAYFSNLDAGLTHYGTGSAPVYFGSGYVTQTDWWKLGFLISLLNICCWLGVGVVWWKIIGFW